MTEFTWSDCITCGVRFAMPTALYNHQRLKGGFHHCPNGHSQGWDLKESELEQMRRQRDRAQQQVARAEDEAREAKAKAAREVAEAKAETERVAKAKKRLEKRTAAGTCPCCQRTFSNMSNHMRNKHPTFVAEAVEAPKLKVVK